MATPKLRKLTLSVCLLLAGCAVTSPHDAELRAMGAQTFGTDANLKICWVPYSGPLSNGLSTVLGNSSDTLAVASDMQEAKQHPVDLILWSESSQVAAATLAKALRYPGSQSGLQHLRLLFVGNAEDAAMVKSAVEATGAAFYFHPQ